MYTVVESNVKTKWANEEYQIFLIKNDFTAKFVVNFCDKIRRAHTVLVRSKM